MPRQEREAAAAAPRPRRGRITGCFNCGEEGHEAKACTKARADPGKGACFKCGVTGHMARDCTATA